MNSKFLVIPLMTVFILLTGCQSKNERMMDDVSDIKEISISKSTNFNKLDEKFFATFQEAKELEIFKNAFSTAKREKMKLVGVNYDLLITAEDGGHFLLQFYLGDEREASAFFYIGHENKIYFTSEEITHDLRKMIKP
ncbi:hypothetical protein HNO89_000952 [Sporosarcina luteola]|nr:hypothetical protein [Sporosarcina luteola]